MGRARSPSWCTSRTPSKTRSGCCWTSDAGRAKVCAMDLVQIARFADQTEAQVAASALRASGIFAGVHDGSGQNYYLVNNFRLAVPEADAVDARAYIAS